jgi:hypothetical protein
MRSSSALAAITISVAPGASTFDPIVLISRFISCTRKSSLRPHGSGAARAAPVLEMTAHPHDFLVDVGPRHEADDLLRDAAGSPCRSAAESPAARAAALELLLAVARSRSSVHDAADGVEPAVEVRCDESAFGLAHDHERVQRLADDELDEEATPLGRRGGRRAFARISMSCGIRSTSDAVSAPVTRPRRARRRSRRHALEQRFVEHDVALGGDVIRRQREFDAAARHALLESSDRTRLSTAPSDCGALTTTSRTGGSPT